LKSLKQTPEEGKDGLYTLKIENSPFDVYFRFANGYAYVTARDADAIAKNALRMPNEVLPAKEIGVVSASVRLDQIPDDLKQLAIGQLGLRLADVRDRNVEGQTKAQKEFGNELAEDMANRFKTLLKDGREFAFRVDVDRQKNDLAVELSLTGNDGSKLATDISALGKEKSVFGGLLRPDAAFQALVNVSLPENLHKSLSAVIDESIAQALSKEEDKAKRQKAEQVLKALEPSLKAGECDAAIVLREPAAEGKHHTLVGGI